MKDEPKHTNDNPLEDEIKNKLIEAEANIVDYVQHNPLKTIGFSLLAGAFIAQLLKHRDK